MAQTRGELWVRAEYRYVPDAEHAQEELSFEVADRILVTDRTDADGWWKGILNGREAFFPCNYVTVDPEAPHSYSSAYSSPSSYPFSEPSRNYSSSQSSASYSNSSLSSRAPSSPSSRYSAYPSHSSHSSSASSHSSSERSASRVSSVPCRHFLKGFCELDGNCRFAHVVPPGHQFIRKGPSEPPPNVKNRGTVGCRHWMKGHCELGSKCGFRHDSDFGQQKRARTT